MLTSENDFPSWSNREAGAAAAGSGGLRIVDAERGADQVVDEVDLGAGQIVERDRVDQDAGAGPLDHDVIGSAVAAGVLLALIK